MNRLVLVIVGRKDQSGRHQIDGAGMLPRTQLSLPMHTLNEPSRRLCLYPSSQSDRIYLPEIHLLVLAQTDPGDQ